MIITTIGLLLCACSFLFALANFYQFIGEKDVESLAKRHIIAMAGVAIGALTVLFGLATLLAEAL